MTKIILALTLLLAEGCGAAASAGVALLANAPDLIATASGVAGAMTECGQRQRRMDLHLVCSIPDCAKEIPYDEAKWAKRMRTRQDMGGYDPVDMQCRTTGNPTIDNAPEGTF